MDCLECIVTLSAVMWIQEGSAPSREALKGIEPPKAGDANEGTLHTLRN